MFESFLKPTITTQTVSGSICTFNTQYAMPLKSHTVNIDSVSGVSAINVYATGRNIFPTISTFPYTASSNTYFLDFAANGTARKIPTIHLQEGVEYTLSFDVTIDNEPFNISVGAGSGSYSRDIKTVTGLSSGRVSVTFTPTDSDLQAGDIMAFRCPRYGSVQSFTFTIDNVQLEYGGLTAYQPFGTQTTIPIGQTVNEGEYNARTGVMEVTQPSVQTIQLPPCPIDTLEGVNNIWADTGDTTLQYPKFG